MSDMKSDEVVDVSKPAGEGMVRVTFLPEGRTVEFPFDTLPYEGHGLPMSFLDVAENYDIFLDHACRSEEHTSELQSHVNIVCRLLLEKKHAKSDFLDTMSHEIRTPINAVINLTALALETDLTPKQIHFFKIVRSPASTLLSPTKALLD